MKSHQARTLSDRVGWFAKFQTARLTWPVRSTEELFICSSERIVTCTHGVQGNMRISADKFLPGFRAVTCAAFAARAHERAKNAHAVRWREITSTLVAYNPAMRHKASAGPPLQWRLAVLRWLSIAEVLTAFDTAAPL